MKFNVGRLSKTVWLGILLAAYCSTPLATGSGAVLPGEPSGGVISEAVSDGSVLEINPARDEITTTGGLKSIGSVRVDTTNGIIGGYSEFNLETDSVLDFGVDASGTMTSGFLSGSGTIAGPGVVGVDTVEITLQMSFDGSFITTAGVPTLILSGSIIGVTASPLSPLVNDSHIASLSFISSVLDGGAITTEFVGEKNMVDFAGATGNVLSSTADDLEAVLSLTFDATIGDLLVFSAQVSGTATPEPNPAGPGPSDGDGSMLGLLASAGAVDYSETAIARILLPEGYSIASTDPLFDGIVETTVVPLPAAGWLFIAGLMTLMRYRNQD